MTRTKLKNSKPLFNAGTERYMKDWKTCEIMISCRDSRERENDALLGVVYLPLSKVFHNRSQVMDTYALVGGIGYGRVRISLVFRSLEMQLPRNLLGWDYGTLEIKSPVRSKGGLPHELTSHRIKIRSNIGRIKMEHGEGSWHLKHHDAHESGFLPVRKRYAMPLIIEFRKSSLASDTNPVFAVFWLKYMPDEEEQSNTLQVWKGGKENLKRATTCARYEGLEDAEKPLGEIEITMRFWRALSGYHKRFARSGGDLDMRNVVEVLDTLNDEYQEKSGKYDNPSSEDDSNSDFKDENGNGIRSRMPLRVQPQIRQRNRIGN